MSETDDPAAPHLAVVATAGHVDHGKSSLILRLTGTDPDRLAEEKRRGLTIELGYAWCTLPSGREVGFVDVPGHERFVRTMLSGVGPVRLVLFVVAADEGWKPQSEEHLEIVDVLGAHGGVIALTKRDLVDAARLPTAEADVRDRVHGTALENAPIVACSSVSGEGLDELVQALDRMLADAPEPERQGRTRWFLDRVFTVRGAGTVVTGTLTGGSLTIGDEIQIHPSGQLARVRTLQAHQRQVPTAQPVARVAANLTGVDRDRLARGSVATRPDEWRPTDVVEARLTPVRSTSRPMTSRGAFSLHSGSTERAARVRLYGTSSLSSEGAFARIRLSEPTVLDVGDRFVLRESGRRETVAGGVVLDVEPPARPGTGAIERLSARSAAPRERLPSLVVAERGAAPELDVAVLTGIRPTEIEGARRCGAWWVSNHVRATFEQELSQRLERFHASDPLAAGEDIAALRPTLAGILRGAGAPARADLADAILDDLVGEGRFAREGTILRLSSHAAGVPSAEGTRLVEAVASGEPTPPTVAELTSAGFSRSLIDATVRSGALVRIAPDLVLSAAFVARAIDAVAGAGEEGITVSALREQLGTSRRYAVPLLEHLDRTGVTRRRGDLRVLRGS